VARPGERSRRIFEESRRYIPGGVNSPVRSFRAVGGGPVVIAAAAGSRVTDVDGNVYVDYVGSWGPLILGHADPEVVEAVAAAARRGTSYGGATEAELELARAISQAVPSMEMLRFVSSGTEATMSALRLARAFTGRDLILKFEGCYHGHADSLLVRAGSGVATLGLPDSPGVPGALAELTLVAPYNDTTAVDAVFDRHGAALAAVIVEPVAANMGVVLPEPGFLERLRSLCDAAGALLIFDEVVTGFRLRYGGFQDACGVRPDLTCLGKVVGGGLPVGVYGGRRQVMSLVAPEGAVYQAGTLAGNPLAMAAGLATLRRLARPGFYEALEERAARLADGLRAAAARAELPATLNRIGSMLTVFFAAPPVRDYASARTAETERYARFFRELLENGVYFPPAQFEAAFLSAAHADADLSQTLAAAERAFLAAR
jgi:glutamate-1-semialdehyde 2,1-aminomutase